MLFHLPFLKESAFLLEWYKKARKKYGQQSPELERDIRAFVLQEATHTKHHQLYNNNLEAQGYENVVHDFIDRSEKMLDKYFSTKSKLAVVCAYEHYTAILGNYLLRNPEVLDLAPKNMSLVWEWHAAEETEHKAVCFDLYQAIGGSWLMRVMLFCLVSVEFVVIFLRLYINMLWKDGAFQLHRIPTTFWRSIKFFWGKRGAGWPIIFHGVRYISPFFHPWNQDNKKLLQEWLVANNDDVENLLQHK